MEDESILYNQKKKHNSKSTPIVYNRGIRKQNHCFSPYKDVVKKW